MVKHPVILRGYHAALNDLSAPPLLVKRLDQEFVPGVLDGSTANDATAKRCAVSEPPANSIKRSRAWGRK